MIICQCHMAGPSEASSQKHLSVFTPTSVEFIMGKGGPPPTSSPAFSDKTNMLIVNLTWPHIQTVIPNSNTLGMPTHGC